MSECSEMGLVYGGSWLRFHDTLLEQGVGEHSTLSLTKRMRGGQPVRVNFPDKYFTRKLGLVYNYVSILEHKSYTWHLRKFIRH